MDFNIGDIIIAIANCIITIAGVIFGTSKLQKK